MVWFIDSPAVNSLNPKIINVLAKQQAELAQSAPDGKLEIPILNMF